MTFPIRCFTCNKCIGQYEKKYIEMTEKGITNEEIFKHFNISRYCCRRMFLGYVNIDDQILFFKRTEFDGSKEKKS
jgi:DNA-directed RNA polymerase subunit N (RpoN/RPB10)